MTGELPSAERSNEMICVVPVIVAYISLVVLAMVIVASNCIASPDEIVTVAITFHPSFR